MAKKIIVVLLSAAMLLAAGLYLFFWQVRVQPFTSIKYLDGIPVQIRQMYGDESLQDKKLQLTAVVKISGKIYSTCTMELKLVFMHACCR